MQPLKTQLRRGSKADSHRAWNLFQSHLNWLNVSHETGEVIQRRISSEFLDHLFDMYPSAVATSDDGVVIGFTVTEVRDIGVLEVMNLYVDDQFRRQGIGKSMLQIVDEQCHERGIHTIVGFSSDRYYPNKPHPDQVFSSAGFDVQTLSPHTQMYMRQVPLTTEEEAIVHPARRRMFPTVDDLDDDREDVDRQIVTLDIVAPSI